MFILTTHTIAHYADLPLCDHCAGSSKLSKLKKKIVHSALTSQRYFEVYIDVQYIDIYILSQIETLNV